MYISNFADPTDKIVDLSQQVQDLQHALESQKRISEELDVKYQQKLEEKVSESEKIAFIWNQVKAYEINFARKKHLKFTFF